MGVYNAYILSTHTNEPVTVVILIRHELSYMSI